MKNVKLLLLCILSFIFFRVQSQIRTREPVEVLQIISTDSLEFNSAFSPDGSSFYFSRSINKRTTIFISKKTEGKWSNPKPASFSSPLFSDADPAFSPTGELYFISNRPSHARDTTKDYDIWKVIPSSQGQWSEPINVTELNSNQDEYYISFTKVGDVYFASSRDGGYGEEDIYYCEVRNNKYGSPKNVGNKVNSIHADYDPFVTGDGSALIFTSSSRNDSVGKADLYWSVTSENDWIEAKHFETEINTPTRDFCPYITSDSKYFFYSSEGDVKLMHVKNLPEELRIRISK